MRRVRQIDMSIHAAAVSAAALIAHQVGGKATRDALFLSHFDVTGLAWMVVAASLLSILLGVASARLLSSMAPGRLVPRAFLTSAGLLLIEWGISYVSPGIAAVLVYLQIAALGSALISAFWTLLGDRFDPHAAKEQFRRVVAASTFGGMIGGLFAEAVGTTLGVTAMLPVLATLDLICALLTWDLGRGIARAPKAAAVTERPYSALRVLRGEPYLRHLALLIVLTTVGAGLLDYVFKASAAATHQGGAQLVRFFAIFYAVTGVVTFLVQIALSRFSIDRLGLAGTIGSLPFALAVGSLGGIIIPGFASASLARGGEAVVRSSLFRSGYELFFAAVPSRDRHRTKPILDIGFERIGDMLGGLLISLLLVFNAGSALAVMLVITGFTALAGFWISRTLHQGYVKALETNLLNQSIHIDISDIRDSESRIAMRRTVSRRAPVDEKSKTIDSVFERVMELHSTDPAVVRRALRGPLDATLAAHAVTLLGWDEVADDAVDALQKIAPAITGLLVDALLDPDQQFEVRRRIPLILAVTDSKRAVDGLTQGLFDNRFDVRFHAGRALAQIQDRAPGIAVDQSMITEAVQQELLADKEAWEGRRVIDSIENEPASAGSEHVFRLLSLILPRNPMRIAYRGLHSGDKRLKGMALEYLESVLPSEVRRSIRPLLETA